MKLKEQEIIIKEYRHHPVLIIARGIKYFFVLIPFYLVIFMFSDLIGTLATPFFYAGITLFIACFALYDLTLFYMDKLVITNHRIVNIDWRGLFKTVEAEVEIADIQDIVLVEHGFVSYIPLFDFGLFTIETASAQTAISFEGAPDPKGIKNFIYHLGIKPTRIEPAQKVSSNYDREGQTTEKESASTGSNQR